MERRTHFASTTLLTLAVTLSACSSGSDEADAGLGEPTSSVGVTVEPLVVSGGWWLTDANYLANAWGATAPSDFDGDRKDDLLLCRVGSGCGTVGFDAYNRLRSNVVQSRSSLMSGGVALPWNPQVRAVADFTGDGLADAIFETYSDPAHLNAAPNQQYLLTRDPSTYGFKALTFPYVGTSLTGGFTLDALDHASAIGDFDNDGVSDVLTMGAAGTATAGAIATLSAYGAGTLYASIVQLPGTWAGHWNHGTGDAVVGAGDVNHDGQSDLGIYSNWGIGVLTRDPFSGKLKELAMAANGTDIGKGYVLNRARIIGFGNFDGDPDDEVMIARWCPTCADLGDEYAIANVTAGGFSVIAWAAEGTMTSGGWRMGYANGILAPGGHFIDYNGDGRADFLVQSSWGLGVITVGTFFGLPAGTTYEAYKTIAIAPWGTNIGGHVLSLTGMDVIGYPGRYMGLGRYEFIHWSSTELAFLGVAPGGGFETLARAGVDHEVVPPQSAPPPSQPPPPSGSTCSKSSFQFCWYSTAALSVPAAVVACDRSTARSTAQSAGIPGGSSACPGCALHDGACPKAPSACSSGTPTYAEMCCDATGTTYSGVGCSLTEAKNFAKLGDTGCSSWLEGTCPFH